MNGFNIDFTDVDLDWESRPHRNMWIGVLITAFEDAVREPALLNDPRNISDTKRWRYKALDWWYKDSGVEIIKDFDGTMKEVVIDYAQERKAVGNLANQDIKLWQNRVTRTIMHKRMPDHITDDFPSAEDANEYWGNIFDAFEIKDEILVDEPEEDDD